jgi:hypothetical protein
MSDFIQQIPLAEIPQAQADKPPEARQAQSGHDPLGIAIEAAQSANLKDEKVRWTAANAFAQELFQTPDWKKLLGEVAEPLKPYMTLPVVSCGTPLHDKGDEDLAQSFIQTSQIQDPNVINSVRNLLEDMLRQGQKEAVTDPTKFAGCAV